MDQREWTPGKREQGCVRTLGVEEEFLLLDPESGRPRALGGAVLALSGETELTGELQREQIETETRPCRDLDDLARQLRRARVAAAEAARAAGAELAAVGTSPVPVEPTLSPSPRYAEMAERFGLTVSEQLTCGQHVHIAVDSPEEGVAALDRIRPWLPALLALSANSPFWHGEDSRYASYRNRVWSRWPSAGPYGPFGTPAAYRATVDTMLATGTVVDEGMVYFDARLARLHPTVELRVPDVCLRVEDAVLVAALARALVETALAVAAPFDPVRTEVLRLATWRAARSGTSGALLDPGTWREAPAADVLRALLAHVTPALERAGDRERVEDLLGAVLARGTGADAQRATFARTGDLAAVALGAAAATTT
jgi:glutamate---cysteine ligase / carboxylate-amine ligase